MYRINPTETFRERQLILLDEAANRRPVRRRVRSGPRPNPISVAATTLSFVITLVVLAGIVLVALSRPAHADTVFTVNSTGDQSDLDFPCGTFDGSSDGVCDVDSDAAGEQCTLRAAIQEANVTAGAETINFKIPGSGVHTIAPNSPLPPVQDQVTLDGYSQPGTSPTL